jgi:hypothetical protein
MKINEGQYKILKFSPILIGVAFFILNYFTPLIADDFLYSFIFKTGNRLSSISDIFVSQYNHYYSWGGRTVAIFLTQLFLYFGDKNIFNVCNTIVYCAFIYLICFHITGSFKKIKPILFLAVNIILWFLVPAWGQNFLWLTGSCVYLWTSTIILFFLVPFRKKNDDSLYKLSFPLSVLFFVLGILAGWSNENSGASVLFLLIAYFVMKIIHKQKVVLFEVLGGLGFLIGFCILVAAPGNYSRFDAANNIHQIRTGFGVILQFLKATEMFFQYCGFLLTGFCALLIYELNFRQKQKINWFIWYYLLAGIAGVYSMTLSPGFPERAYLIVVVYLCITLLGLLQQIKIDIPEMIKKNIPTAGVIVLIFFFGSFLMASRNILGVYLKWQNRLEYIQVQKSKGIQHINVIAPIPAGDKHTALFGLDDVWQDSTVWINTTTATFFEIKSIKGVDRNDEQLKLKTLSK